MRSFLKSTVAALLFIACANENPKDQLANLNGYWEIDKVEFSKDSVKEYTISQYVDYIEMNGQKGSRQKVRPQLDGSYQAFDDAENIDCKVEDGELILYYSTPFSSRKEKVISAEEDILRIENEEGVIYQYKKFTPLLENYEKE